MPESVILAGRFRMDSVVRSSNRGNIYAATDLTDGQAVIVKEARPFVSELISGMDVVSYEFLLVREGVILDHLRTTCCVPTPIMSFREWEHTYSVLSRVAGVPLHHMMGDVNHVVLPYVDRPGVIAGFVSTFSRVACAIIDAVTAVHAADVIIGDISASNVIFDDSTGMVGLVDFELSAYAGAPGIDSALSVMWHTPGLAPRSRMKDVALSKEHDWQAVGLLLFNWICFLHVFVDYDPSATSRFLRKAQRLGIPENLILGLRALINEGDPVIARALFRDTRQVDLPRFHGSHQAQHESALSLLASGTTV